MAAETTAPGMMQLLQTAIREGIKKQVESRWEDYKKEFLVKLEQDKNVIIAGIVLDVESMVRYETRVGEIVITVRKIDTNA